MNAGGTTHHETKDHTKAASAGVSTVFSTLKPRLHEHQVPNPDSNLDHNPHGRGGLSLDLNPVCLRVNTTNQDQDLDQNPCVNRALYTVLKLHSLQSM